MSGEEFHTLNVVERAYGRTRGELPFESLLNEIDPSNEDAVAELIEADGRWRIERGMPVDLDRYSRFVTNISERTLLLDAAIDVSLRWRSKGPRVTTEAVESLVRDHPRWESTIRETASLNAAVMSTAGIRRRVDQTPSKRLPMEFGPVLPNGQRRYVLEQLLGHGAFGQVYLGRDRQLSEEGHAALVAIKILASADHSPFDRQRLIEEATKVRRISHPNVVMVIDRGVSDDQEDYIVYEYVDGGDLDDRLSRQPCPWPPRNAAGLVAKIARGIHAAHSAGVIHCDLKPGNIMMTATVEPKVTDFGVARRVGESSTSDGSPDPADNGRPFGNLAFISPEQFRGEIDAITVQADVYSLGGILYHLLMGSLPSGSTLTEIAKAHSSGDGDGVQSLRSLRPDIDRDLDTIVRKALAKKPVDRYSSAAAMAEDLERWLRFEPLSWNAPGWMHVVRLWVRRKPALAGALAVIVLLAVVGGWTALHFMSLARERRMEAAIAQARLDEQNLAKANQDRKVVMLANKLVTLQKDYRINIDILPQMWYLEYLLGPKVLDVPEAQTQLWQNRVATLRWFVNDAREHGRAEAMETLLWESALAFWLVGSGDFTEAEPLLTANIERWRGKLSPDDQWLTDLQTIRVCAAANRLIAQSKNSALTPEQHSDLNLVAASLMSIDQSLPADHRGTPLHYLVLDRLAEFYGPALLNVPARVEQIKKTRESLLKRK